MQLTFDVRDHSAQKLIAQNSKEQLNSLINTLIEKYISTTEQEIIIHEGDDEVYGMWVDREMRKELDFVGMWTDREISVEKYVREMRKGRRIIK